MDAVIHFEHFVFLRVPEEEVGHVALANVVRVSFEYLEVKALQFKSILVNFDLLDLGKLFRSLSCVWR